MGRNGDVIAALIAAWRGDSPRVSEEARELLPSGYPYLSEFERALALDPGNEQLRKDIEYIRSLAAGTESVLKNREAETEASVRSDAKELGLKSLDKGYMGDALKYLHLAHEHDPEDFEVMLKPAGHTTW